MSTEEVGWGRKNEGLYIWGKKHKENKNVASWVSSVTNYDGDQGWRRRHEGYTEKCI